MNEFVPLDYMKPYHFSFFCSFSIIECMAHRAQALTNTAFPLSLFIMEPLYFVSRDFYLKSDDSCSTHFLFHYTTSQLFLRTIFDEHTGES